MTKNKKFFEKPTDSSLVKSRIVAKYFSAWRRVILPWVEKRGGNIAYLDLFAGPGSYADGTESTPLKILRQAIVDPKLQQRLITLFNDSDKKHATTLQEAVRTLPDVHLLRNQPIITHEQVGEQVIRSLQHFVAMPTLSFIDPWGYKGLSLELIKMAVKEWGCDCIFFFNYNRINMALPNPFVIQHMNDLFGYQQAQSLRTQLADLNPEERETAIIEAISQVLKEGKQRYVLPFSFKDEDGDRTSHHLFFVSKHIRGYEIMKEIMAKESSEAEQGVPTFFYNPASERQPLLFSLSRPLEDLADMLIQDFAGRTLTMQEIYEQHHVDRRYIKSNYKEVLLQLEKAGRIQANPAKRPRGFADNVQVTFPPN